MSVMMFTVSLQTPRTSVGRVNQRNNITSTRAVTTGIPGIVTQASAFEVGESSRRTKRSKRPSFQSRTPVRFDLNVEDGDVRKEYDKYIGVSEGNSITSIERLIQNKLL